MSLTDRGSFCKLSEVKIQAPRVPVLSNVFGVCVCVVGGVCVRAPWGELRCIFALVGWHIARIMSRGVPGLQGPHC